MKKMFYVEDNEEFLNLATSSIPAGYQCTPFTEPSKALAAINKGVIPNLIVTDLQMPGKQGLEFIRELRERGYNNPVIIATAHIERSQMVTAIRLGVCDILEKPFTIDAFYASIRRAEFNMKVSMAEGGMSRKLLNIISALEEILSGYERMSNIERPPHLRDLVQSFKDDFQNLEQEAKALRARALLESSADGELDETLKALTKVG